MLASKYNNILHSELVEALKKVGTAHVNQKKNELSASQSKTLAAARVLIKSGRVISLNY